MLKHLVPKIFVDLVLPVESRLPRLGIIIVILMIIMMLMIIGQLIDLTPKTRGFSAQIMFMVMIIITINDDNQDSR